MPSKDITETANIDVRVAEIKSALEACYDLLAFRKGELFDFSGAAAEESLAEISKRHYSNSMIDTGSDNRAYDVNKVLNSFEAKESKTSEQLFFMEVFKLAKGLFALKENCQKKLPDESFRKVNELHIERMLEQFIIDAKNLLDQNSGSGGDYEEFKIKVQRFISILLIRQAINRHIKPIKEYFGANASGYIQTSIAYKINDRYQSLLLDKYTDKKAINPLAKLEQNDLKPALTHFSNQFSNNKKNVSEPWFQSEVATDYRQIVDLSLKINSMLKQLETMPNTTSGINLLLQVKKNLVKFEKYIIKIENFIAEQVAKHEITGVGLVYEDLTKDISIAKQALNDFTAALLQDKHCELTYPQKVSLARIAPAAAAKLDYRLARNVVLAYPELYKQLSEQEIRDIYHRYQDDIAINQIYAQNEFLHLKIPKCHECNGREYYLEKFKGKISSDINHGNDDFKSKITDLVFDSKIDVYTRQQNLVTVLDQPEHLKQFLNYQQSLPKCKYAANDFEKLKQFPLVQKILKANEQQLHTWFKRYDFLKELFLLEPVKFANASVNIAVFFMKNTELREHLNQKAYWVHIPACGRELELMALAKEYNIQVPVVDFARANQHEYHNPSQVTVVSNKAIESCKNAALNSPTQSVHQSKHEESEIQNKNLVYIAKNEPNFINMHLAWGKIQNNIYSNVVGIAGNKAALINYLSKRIGANGFLTKLIEDSINFAKGKNIQFEGDATYRDNNSSEMKAIQVLSIALQDQDVNRVIVNTLENTDDARLREMAVNLAAISKSTTSSDKLIETSFWESMFSSHISNKLTGSQIVELAITNKHDKQFLDKLLKPKAEWFFERWFEGANYLEKLSDDNLLQLAAVNNENINDKLNNAELKKRIISAAKSTFLFVEPDSDEFLKLVQLSKNKVILGKYVNGLTANLKTLSIDVRASDLLINTDEDLVKLIMRYNACSELNLDADAVRDKITHYIQNKLFPTIGEGFYEILSKKALVEFSKNDVILNYINKEKLLTADDVFQILIFARDNSLAADYNLLNRLKFDEKVAEQLEQKIIKANKVSDLVNRFNNIGDVGRVINKISKQQNRNESQNNLRKSLFEELKTKVIQAIRISKPIELETVKNILFHQVVKEDTSSFFKLALESEFGKDILWGLVLNGDKALQELIFNNYRNLLDINASWEPKNSIFENRQMIELYFLFKTKGMSNVANIIIDKIPHEELSKLFEETIKSTNRNACNNLAINNLINDEKLLTKFLEKSDLNNLLKLADPKVEDILFQKKQFFKAFLKKISANDEVSFDNGMKIQFFHILLSDKLWEDKELVELVKHINIEYNNQDDVFYFAGSNISLAYDISSPYVSSSSISLDEESDNSDEEMFQQQQPAPQKPAFASFIEKLRKYKVDISKSNFCEEFHSRYNEAKSNMKENNIAQNKNDLLLLNPKHNATDIDNSAYRVAYGSQI